MEVDGVLYEKKSDGSIGLSNAREITTFTIVNEMKIIFGSAFVKSKTQIRIRRRDTRSLFYL